MPDTTLAYLIIPFLIALTLVLECTRIGCQWIDGRVRRGRRVTRVPEQPAEPLAEKAISRS